VSTFYAIETEMGESPGMAVRECPYIASRRSPGAAEAHDTLCTMLPKACASQAGRVSLIGVTFLKGSMRLNDALGDLRHSKNLYQARLIPVTIKPTFFLFFKRDYLGLLAM